MKTLFSWFIAVTIVAFFHLTVDAATFFTNRVDQEFYEQYASNAVKTARATNPRMKRNEPVRAEGSGLSFNGFVGLGSMENAINLYAGPNSNDIGVFVHQRRPNGTTFVVASSAVSLQGRNTLATIEDFFQEKAAEVTRRAFSNQNANKSELFYLFAYTVKYSEVLGEVVYFYHSSTFLCTQADDGSYVVPDFSNHTLRIADTMVFEIPTLQWARLEISRNPVTTGASNLFLELDTRINPPSPPNELNHKFGFIQISTSYATSGTTGDTILKLSTVTREGDSLAFQVFGPMGTRITETPITIDNFQVVEGETSFYISGGDPGRMFVIDCASDLAGPWTQMTEPDVVPRYGRSIPFQQEAIGPQCFYRIRAVEGVPFLRL